IEEDRRVRLGEGETQYQHDADDPKSMTDVHWLATITGAASNQQRVDIVIDTDGLFLLFDRANREGLRERMGELRSEDRQKLLAGNHLNRWIPAATVTEAMLSRTRLSRFQAMKATVMIRLETSESIKVHLASDTHVRLATDGLRGMLGDRFHS
ncbi:MAG TPA: hypothetical protein VIX84_12715, partial [Acidimicrobiales bacterium]